MLPENHLGAERDFILSSKTSSKAMPSLYLRELISSRPENYNIA